MTTAGRDLVGRVLAPPALNLFESLPTQDQRHGFDVALALLHRGHRDTDLLAAALLHDAGKAGAGLTVFHRTAVVLLQAGRPGWLEDLDEAAQKGWRRSFWVHQRHAEIGAELAREAGCSDLTIWLICNHHRSLSDVSDEGRRALLELLQREDDSH